MKTIFKINRLFVSALSMLCMIAFSNLNVHAEATENCSIEIMSDNCPTASFSIVNNGVDAGTPVQFQNQSTGGTSYLWDFGDGNSSTAENPTHIYNAAGTYSVKLTVFGEGCPAGIIGTEDVVMN